MSGSKPAQAQRGFSSIGLHSVGHLNPSNRDRLSADSDALPEGDPIADILRFGFRVGIKPGGIAVISSVDVEAVIVRGSLPGADSRCIARPEERGIYRIQREIMITLDDDRVVAAGYQRAIPSCRAYPVNADTYQI